MASYSSPSSPELTLAPANHPSDGPSRALQFSSLNDALDDLSSRFILNLPEEELASVERICFQVEQAHWYYEDFVREENPSFPSFGLKKFSSMLFHACPLLQDWSGSHEEHFDRFMQYKTRVPVCGAIMLNDTWDKCVLVKGWKSSSGWGFPKGKINEQEPPHKCAIREVLEETGYDISSKINAEDHITLSIREQKISLYIIPNVPEETDFQTRTRKEISKIAWWRLSDLPTWRRQQTVPGKFYLISPFIARLKVIVTDRKRYARNGRRVPKKTGRSNQLISSTTAVEQESALSPFVTPRDQRAQESSSQSSSADNAGPQTPSPQMREPDRNYLATEAKDDAGTNRDTLSTEVEANPELARLFHSLVQINGKPELGGIVPQVPSIDSTPRRPMSRESTPSVHSQAALQDQGDWSIRSPPHAFNNPPLPPSRSIDAALGIDPSSRMKQTDHLPLTVDMPSAGYKPNGVSSVPLSATLSSSADSSVSAGSSSHARRSSPSRRSSYGTDISVYLPQRPHMPSSAKEMKQRSLLDNVAEESARMTQLLNQRASQSNLRSSHAFDEYRLAAPSAPPLHPNAAFSQWDQRGDARAHSHFPSPTAPQHRGQIPMLGHHVGNPHDLTLNDDPFRVRPHTSIAFRGQTGFGMHSSSSASMGQSELLSILSARGPAAPAPPVGHSGLLTGYPPHNRRPIPHAVPVGAPVLGPLANQLPPAIPRTYTPILSPASASSSSPFNRLQRTSPAPAASSASLLSILNAAPNGVSNNGVSLS